MNECPRCHREAETRYPFPCEECSKSIAEDVSKNRAGSDKANKGSSHE